MCIDGGEKISQSLSADLSDLDGVRHIKRRDSHNILKQKERKTCVDTVIA